MKLIHKAEKTDKQSLSKIKLVVLAVVLLIVIGGIIGGPSNNKKTATIVTTDTAKTSPTPKVKVTSTPKPKATLTPTPSTTPAPAQTQAPTKSIATLDGQSVTILTPVLNDFMQQMSQGQADAAESNAGDVSSDFHAWETAEQDKENITNNNEEVTAYNKADNAYYDAHQNEPTALSSWDNDAGNLPGDISDWANAEEVVVDDQASSGSIAPSDQQTANSDMQQYKTDLANAQADLAQL
jgi:hypothetical protein